MWRQEYTRMDDTLFLNPSRKNTEDQAIDPLSILLQWQEQEKSHMY